VKHLLAALLLVTSPVWALKATDGQIIQRSLDTFSVTSAEMRASSNASGPVTLQVINAGPSAEISHLRSGDVVSQIGLKIYEENTCNLVYVMRIFTPVPKLVVSVKSNPGMSRHEQCLDHGYKGLDWVELPTGYEPFTLTVIPNGQQLHITYTSDSATIDRIITVPRSTGTVGVRSDNVAATFRLSVTP
jgi:hypothetical protein